ncbi:MAG: hypothetical protein CMF41_04935 [Legionellales bacterium]|nr:hypothetical protein [Legionellales bacterium]
MTDSSKKYLYDSYTSCWKTFHYQKGEVILRINQPIPGLMWVKKGRISFRAELVNRSSQIVNILHENDGFGFQALVKSHHSFYDIVAENSVTIMVLSKDDLDALKILDKEYTKKIIEYVLRQISERTLGVFKHNKKYLKKDDINNTLGLLSLKKSTKRSIKDKFQYHSLFKFTPDVEIENLIKIGTRYEIKETCIHRIENNKDCFLVLEGAVQPLVGLKDDLIAMDPVLPCHMFIANDSDAYGYQKYLKVRDYADLMYFNLDDLYEHQLTIALYFQTLKSTLDEYHNLCAFLSRVLSESNKRKISGVSDV